MMWLMVFVFFFGFSKFSFAAATEDLTIKRIQKRNDSSYTVTCETAFVGPNNNKIKLNIIDEALGTITLDAKNGGSLTSSICEATFQYLLTSLGGKNVSFLLKETGMLSPVVEGKTENDIFPNFTTSSAEMILGSDESASIYILKVTTDGDLDLIDPGSGTSITPIISNESIQYYELDSVPTSVSQCYSFDITAIVCDVAMNVTPSEIMPGEVKRATLKYSSSESTSIQEIELQLKGIIGHIDVLLEDKVCVSSDLTASCPVVDDGDDEHNMTIIGFQYNGMKSYTTHTIKDYNIVGYAFTSAIEVRWDWQLDVTTYYISLDSNDSQSATVFCDPPEGSLPCFGYFSELPNGTYRVTVQPKNGEDVDETNRIESDAITVGSKDSDQPKEQLHLDWHLDRFLGKLEVCFNHISKDIEKFFSYYEFVLINKRAQFVKHYLKTEATENSICFSLFDLKETDLDISEGASLFVVQRALDGFSVLASGSARVI